jgi:hypothetical protein
VGDYFEILYLLISNFERPDKIGSHVSGACWVVPVDKPEIPFRMHITVCKEFENESDIIIDSKEERNQLR